MNQPKSLYEIFGVHQNATAKEIRKAYRKLALEKHPDRNPERREEAEKELKAINAAFDVLSDPDKRRAYDSWSKQPWSRPARHPENRGTSNPSREPKNRGAQRSERKPGGDLRVKTIITENDARQGLIREIVVNAPTKCHRCDGEGADPMMRTSHHNRLCDRCSGFGCLACFNRGFMVPACRNCQGSGAIEAARRVVVTIPPGVSSGDRVKVKGAGMPSVFSGMPSGDLYIELQVFSPPHH